MTRQQAIEILESTDVHGLPGAGYNGGVAEATRMALESLKVDERYDLEYEKTCSFELREYTQEEQSNDMRKLLKDKGLHGAVEQYCDDINSYASALSYMGHRGIQECLCNILDLIDEYEGMKSEKF